MEQNNKNKIIYSLKVAQQLMLRGFMPVQTMPNPIKPQLTCWVFDWTEEFDKVMGEILSSFNEGGKVDG